MTDENFNTITGDVFNNALMLTEGILKRDTLTDIERANFTNQRLILKLLEINNKKTNTMYAWYQVKVHDEKVARNTVQKWEPRVWDIAQSIIQWGIIAYLSYLLLHKP